MGQKVSTVNDNGSQNRFNEVSETLEYTEKMVFIRHGHIYIFDIDKNITLFDVPFDISTSEENTALGYNGSMELILVMEKSVKKNQQFDVITFDRDYNIKSRFDFHEKGQKTYAGEVLMKHLKTISFNLESDGHTSWKNIGLIDMILVKNNMGDKIYIQKEAKLSDDGSYIIYPSTYDQKKYDLKTHNQNVCYDKYDNKTFMVVYNNKNGRNNYLFGCYKAKNNGDGSPIRQSSPIELCSYAQYGYIPQVYHFEATEKYLLIGLRINALLVYQSMVYIMDKTSFKILRKFDGWHPTKYCDYTDWCQNNMNILKEVQGMSKMAEDVLKLILSFVS
jgi:hypothetical protein